MKESKTIYRQCVICGSVLNEKGNLLHKHHFPIIKDKGGNDTIIICQTCHVMIHKTPLREFPIQFMNDMARIYSEYETENRWIKLIIAKFIYTIQVNERYFEELNNGMV